MLKRLSIVLALLGGIFIVLSLHKVYVVRDSASGTLYWNADRALLFIEVGSSGARLSYLRYTFEPLFVALGAVRPPDDQRCTESLVIEVTAKNVQSYETNEICFG
jgi:hypothetical protein